LNAGSGNVRTGPLHPAFADPSWREIRIDIDARTGPDLVGSISDMRGVVADARFDALWSSHSVEHLYDHDVLPAFGEFKRVLRADGFAIITCPDIAAVARLLANDDIETVVYKSPAGPIRILDMLYGHARSIESGHVYMAHKTGFTAERLGRLATQAGFAEARVLQGEHYDLWAAFLMPDVDSAEMARQFAGTNLAPLFAPQAPARPAPDKADAAPGAPADRRIRILRA